MKFKSLFYFLLTSLMLSACIALDEPYDDFDIKTNTVDDLDMKIKNKFM